MKAEGYDLAGFPGTGAELMTVLLAGPTKAGDERVAIAVAGLTTRRRSPPCRGNFDRRSPRAGARRKTIPPGPRRASGSPCTASAMSSSASSRRAATTSIRRRRYHDPDLVPPHAYLAFYAWLRRSFAADAIVHLGKHGNLEWLPGKALGLSAACWPEVALGPTPLIYPFIVNDPGEGSQAKRRAAAVIVDHLTPPLTRAEIYGPLAELETLVDEYYLAAGVDPRRRGACSSARFSRPPSATGSTAISASDAAIPSGRSARSTPISAN